MTLGRMVDLYADDAFGMLLAYEVYAVASDRVPPWTRMPASHVPVLLIIGAHLWRNRRRRRMMVA